MIAKEDRERGLAECSPAASPSPDASDEAISKAKREGAAAQIRAIREAGQHRIAERFRAHLQDHGEEHVTSAEEFLRDTEGNKPPAD